MQGDKVERFKKKKNPDKNNVSLGTYILAARLIVLPMEVTSFALYVGVVFPAVLLWKQAHRF